MTGVVRRGREAVRPPAARVLEVLRSYNTGGAQVAEVLGELDVRDVLATLPSRWWLEFDQATRSGSAWWQAVGRGVHGEVVEPLPEGWQWAVEVCGANGHHREAALAAERLPDRNALALPLLVVRCSDWAEPVRRRAERRLAERLSRADTAHVARACSVAWACEVRERGDAAARLVAQCLDSAAPALWQHLLADPEHGVRRRALQEAITRQALDVEQLARLALSDHDVRVAGAAAEHVLLRVVPPEEAPLSAEAQPVVVQLLAARLPRIRAGAVTVLRRGQRPDLARPLLLDRSATVRETARWVLRSHGQDPAEACRALLADPGAPVTAGAVAGVAECGDRADVRWLRAQLRNPRAKARAAAVQALAALEPLPPADLLDILEQGASASVRRAVVEALDAQVSRVPADRLWEWLRHDRPAVLRGSAAVLLRARGAWDRLEADLRLLSDPDAALVEGARADLRTWAFLTHRGYRPPGPGQLRTVRGLLAAAEDHLDPAVMRRIHFRLPAEPGDRTETADTQAVPRVTTNGEPASTTDAADRSARRWADLLRPTGWRRKPK